MGDVIHNLPIVHDMRASGTVTQIDWVVEEAYADIPRMNPGVSRVIPVAQRRWRGTPSRQVAREKDAFEAHLREVEYDLVLDTQGLLKSALLVRMARLAPHGRRVGFSRRLAREGLARFFYDEGYDVDTRAHAIERLRSLAAQALHYSVQGAPRFDLQVPDLLAPWLPHSPYVVLLHATSRVEKEWPLESWRALVQYLGQRGLMSVLPFGKPAEQDVAHRIADDLAHAYVAPAMALRDAAGLIQGASVVVGVDTGLTHLAAALERPTVALFGATPRWRYAPYWTARAVSLGERGRQPDVDMVCRAIEGVLLR